MGRTTKASTAAKAAQDARDGQETGMDTPEAQEAAESAAAGNIIGPVNENELLGCQEFEAELMEGGLVEFAVTAAGGLRLRQEPRLDAPTIAVLPFGAGVFSGKEPDKGWLYVCTGRLEGWMMAEHLEALPLPVLGDGAD